MVVEIAIIGVVVALAVLVANRRTADMKRLLELLIAFRAIIFGAFLLLFALVLIFSGIGFLILVGALLLFLAVLFVVIVRKDGDLRTSTEVIRSWL